MGKDPFPAGTANWGANPRNPFPSSPSQRAGIDLRQEMYQLFRGSSVDPPQAHWVIYRRMDLTDTSDYYEEDQWKEAVGGPQWEFTDEAILARHRAVTTGTLARFFEQETEAGMIHVNFRIYYFEHDANPKKEDEVFEINWVHGHGKKPVPDNVPVGDFVERYNINEVVPHRGDGGRVEFYMCLCRRERIMN